MMIMTGITTTGMWLQDAGAVSTQNTQLLTIFVGIAAVALLMLGVSFAVLAVVALKLNKKVSATIDEVKVKLMPALSSTEIMLRDLAPKVRVVTENLVETSHVVRAKIQEFDGTLNGVNATIRDANEKTKAQVGRVDSIMTTTLTRTAALADTIHNSIRKPVNEVAGVVNGLKAGIDVLLKQASGRGPRVQ